VLSPNQARELGASLRRIRPDAVAQPVGGATLEWYQGTGVFFDLFLERSGNSGVQWLQMTRGGRYIECEFAKPSVATGDTGELEPRDVAHPHSRELSPDRRPDIGLLDELIQILGSCSDQAPFEALLNQLRELRDSTRSSDSH
jgi:hypothetical protein